MVNEQMPVDEAAHRWRTVFLIAAVLVLAAVIAVAVGVSMARDDRPASAGAITSSPTVRTAGALGSIRVPAGPGWKRDADCPRGSRFDDVHVGSQVTITDADGKVLAAVALATGKVVDSATLPGMTTDCLLPFTATVPLGAGPYGVEIGSHGVVRFDETQLAKMDLTLH